MILKYGECYNDTRQLLYTSIFRIHNAMIWPYISHVMKILLIAIISRHHSMGNIQPRSGRSLLFFLANYMRHAQFRFLFGFFDTFLQQISLIFQLYIEMQTPTHNNHLIPPLLSQGSVFFFLYFILFRALIFNYLCSLNYQIYRLNKSFGQVILLSKFDCVRENQISMLCA